MFYVIYQNLMKLSKDKESYTTYIESQLHKFATFIAQSPTNQKRVLRLEELVEEQQSRITELQSSNKLLSIYYNENMNLLYRGSNDGKQIQVQQIVDIAMDEAMQKMREHIQINLQRTQEDLLSKISKLQHTINNNIKLQKNQKQKSSPKLPPLRTVQNNTVNKQIDTQTIRLQVIQWCEEETQKVIQQVLRVHNYVKKKQLAEYKLETKNYFVQKFEKFYKLIRSSINGKQRQNQKKTASYSIGIIPSKQQQKKIKKTDSTNNSPFGQKQSKQQKRNTSTVKMKEFPDLFKRDVPHIKRFSVDDDINSVPKKSKKKIQKSLQKSQISKTSRISKSSNKSGHNKKNIDSRKKLIQSSKISLDYLSEKLSPLAKKKNINNFKQNESKSRSKRRSENQFKQVSPQFSLCGSASCSRSHSKSTNRIKKSSTKRQQVQKKGSTSRASKRQKKDLKSKKKVEIVGKANLQRKERRNTQRQKIN